MKIFQISDGSISCCVIAKSKESALNLETVKEYFGDNEPDNEVEAAAIELDGEITHSIKFEGTKITHTIAEWTYIYEGCGEMMISRSEY